MYLNSVDQRCAGVSAKIKIGRLLEDLLKMANAINTLMMSAAAAVRIEKENNGVG